MARVTPLPDLEANRHTMHSAAMDWLRHAFGNDPMDAIRIIGGDIFVRATELLLVEKKLGVSLFTFDASKWVSHYLQNYWNRVFSGRLKDVSIVESIRETEPSNFRLIFSRDGKVAEFAYAAGWVTTLEPGGIEKLHPVTLTSPAYSTIYRYFMRD